MIKSCLGKKVYMFFQKRSKPPSNSVEATWENTKEVDHTTSGHGERSIQRWCTETPYRYYTTIYKGFPFITLYITVKHCNLVDLLPNF